MNEELKKRLESEPDTVIEEYKKKVDEATLENIEDITKELEDIRNEVYAEYKKAGYNQKDLKISSKFLNLFYEAGRKKRRLEQNEVENSNQSDEITVENGEAEQDSSVEDNNSAKKPEEERKTTESMEDLKAKAQEEAKDKKFTELLAELSKTQTTKVILTVVKDGRAMQANVSEMSNKLKNMLEVQSEIYGANKSEINKIVDDYKVQLATRVNQAKSDLVNNVVEMKKNQEAERENLKKLRNAKKQKRSNYRKVKRSIKDIAKEITEAIMDGDTEKETILKTELKEKKELLSGYDTDITKYEKEVKRARENQKSLKSTMKQNKKDTKEKLTRNKINKLIEENTGNGKAIAKQNVFGKFVGFFSNLGKKIGGDSAFKRKVLNPIKNEIGKMAEEVKALPGNVTTFTQNFISDLKADMQMAITQNNKSIDEIKKDNPKNITCEEASL